MSLTLMRQFPSLSEAEVKALNEQVFAAARRMTSDQLLDLADGLHDVLRARQVLSRRSVDEPRSFVQSA